MTDTGETLGNFIRRERMAQGIGLREMARLIGVSSTFVQKVETKNWKPGEEKLLRISQVLECDPDHLLKLAGKIATNLQNIIFEDPGAFGALLRSASGLSGKELRALAHEADKRKENRRK